MFRFLPWRLIDRRAARAYGIADPALWLARLRQFSQPSEVQEPIELLRAGVYFHARGLIDTKAIQHNLDWVWPYWVERQFDPADNSFIPRAFSFSHINLTHRNWTAVELPELPTYPIVDPRGLLTPLHDGWSIDFWLTDSTGQQLVPARVHEDDVDQCIPPGSDLAVQMTVWEADLQLRERTEVVVEDNLPVLKISVHAGCPGGRTLVMAIRPYNPEGVQFIDEVAELPDRTGWTVNSKTQVLVDQRASRALTSHYDDDEGDLFHRIRTDDDSEPHEVTREKCDQGMATAASLFDFPDDQLHLTVHIPLDGELRQLSHPAIFQTNATWLRAIADAASLAVPDLRIQKLYRTAVRTLVLLSVDDIVPGPYTYRRFWFREACLMMNPIMSIGLVERCERMIERLPGRQLSNGYFRSQDGEWDSNGQVLWMLNRFRRLSHRDLPKAVYATRDKAAQWIDRKRVPQTAGVRHAGLLPAGFSAEYLGPNHF